MARPHIPVVPRTGRARALVWVLLALAVLRPLVAGGGAPRLEVVEMGDGCVLSIESGTPTCACERLPAVWRLLHGLPIPLNRSDVRELVAIPGIGPARAQAIVSDGPYDAVSELVRVPGVGPKIAARVGAHAFVGGPDPACAR